ncbi:MAG: GNAT family N-acetyltransferase [Bacillus sp. (in: firmicutes)]
MDVVIREMQKADIQQVQHVAKSSWNDTYEGIIPLEIQENFLKSAYNNEMMKWRLEHTNLFVAETEGKIIGFANYSRVKDEGKAELAAIYLYSAYQGKGIGTSLLHEGVKNLEGVKEIYINVEKENKIGTTFYKAKGFHVVSEFNEDFQGHILHTVRMMLSV